MGLNIPEDLDEPREIMYAELAEEHGEDPLDADLRQIVHQRLTNLYDNDEGQQPQQ